VTIVLIPVILQAGDVLLRRRGAAKQAKVLANPTNKPSRQNFALIAKMGHNPFNILLKRC
jgi:hypothetical protein